MPSRTITPFLDPPFPARQCVSDPPAIGSASTIGIGPRAMIADRFSAFEEHELCYLPETALYGGKEIQILYLGRAHTRGDSIIFVPQDRIAYLSELYFADQFLFINDGYGLDWLRALDAVEVLEADIFVAGHGPIPPAPRETRSRAAQRRIRQLPPFDGRSTRNCRDTMRSGKLPYAGSISS